jgi:hypothetical protein
MVAEAVAKQIKDSASAKEEELQTKTTLRSYISSLIASTSTGKATPTKGKQGQVSSLAFEVPVEAPSTVESPSPLLSLNMILKRVKK